MILTKHSVPTGSRWAIDRQFLPTDFTLGHFLSFTRQEGQALLSNLQEQVGDFKPLLAPIELDQEVWASGVTYLRSRVEREAESTAADIYAKVYEAHRPELFFKSLGWRAVGSREKIRVRKDSEWNVPEPEMTLVLNRYMEVIGYTAGNDVSSRSIEGENPLYLPQAKSYNGSCALGPGIVLAQENELENSPIHLSILRGGNEVFKGDASTGQMKRKFSDLTEHLGRETSFPRGVFLMTGTGIVPTSEFSLQPGDVVKVSVGELVLENEVDA